jgi:hypothetical protein
MDRKRKLSILMATLALAAAAGHMMQSGQDAPVAGAVASVLPPPDAADEVAGGLAEASAPAAADAEPRAAIRAGSGLALPPEPPAVARTVLAAVQASLPAVGPASDAAAPALVEAAPACTPVLSLAAAPGAVIALSLSAPCDPDARVVVRHEGLGFTAATDAEGRLELEVPALATMARVRVLLPGNEVALAEVAVPEAAGFLRVGLQWMGPDRFELHAFERGAGFGEAGHVHAGSAPGLGRLFALGREDVERPLLAEVYSLPRAHASEVRLHVEAPVTEATCGREMLAEALAMGATAAATLIDVAVEMPGCDATGGFLMLPGLFDDLRLAGN